MRNKPVNVTTQCMATLFMPTAIYAFKRIGHLTDGILIYFGTLFGIMGVYVGYMLTLGKVLGDLPNEFLGALFIILSTVLPVLYIRKWSIEFNKKIKEATPIS